MFSIEQILSSLNSFMGISFECINTFSKTTSARLIKPSITSLVRAFYLVFVVRLIIIVISMTIVTKNMLPFPPLLLLFPSFFLCQIFWFPFRFVQFLYGSQFLTIFFLNSFLLFFAFFVFEFLLKRQSTIEPLLHRLYDNVLMWFLEILCKQVTFSPF